MTFRALLVLIVLSFVVGMSATLVSIAWVIPQQVAHGPTYSVQVDARDVESRDLPQAVRNNIERRVVTLFDKRKQLRSSLYGAEAYVATGVLLTSDGWFALYDPNYTKGKELAWDVHDARGQSHQVDRVVYDALSDIVYAKIEGDGFSLAQFPQHEMSGEFVWGVGNNSWSGTFLEHSDAGLAGEQRVIWHPERYLKLSGDLDPGTILFSEQELFAGIVDRDGNVIPAYLFELQVPSVLAEGSVAYSGLDVSGRYVTKILSEETWQDRSGFLITAASTKPTSSTVGVGDIITAVEGERVRAGQLSEMVLRGPSSVHVSVLRENKMYDILLNKQVGDR